MFTGIVTDKGEVLASQQQGDLRVRIGTAYDADDIDIGASIACEGVCLTVVDKGNSGGQSWFDVQISAETVSRTNIGHNAWSVGRRLNLERALKVGDELGGHIVSGHVDGVAVITAMQDQGDSTRFTFRAPKALGGYIAPKGSVALNGTSLTVNAVADGPDGTTFGVNIIPHTKQVTTWGQARTGDVVNIEIDTLARYVARLRDWQEHPV